MKLILAWANKRLYYDMPSGIHLHLENVLSEWQVNWEEY